MYTPVVVALGGGGEARDQEFKVILRGVEFEVSLDIYHTLSQ